MNTILQDLRYACRSAAKSPGFTLAAILSLALGIGANTAIFSIMNGLLLRPLPYQDPDRLVILWNTSPGLNITQDWFSTAQYFDIKTSHHGFEHVAIAIGGNTNLTGEGEPQRVGTIRVSSNLLPMLGLKPEQGRLFVPAEDVKGAPATAILSYGMWARHYGSDPHMIGKSVTINGVPYEVVGIMPASFSLPREVMPTLDGAEQAEILLPLPLPPNAAQIREHEDYNIIGKLRPGVTVPQAQAEMNTITARLRHDFPQYYPANGDLTFGIVPLLEQVVGDVRTTLLILFGAVGFVLLIACANVANLLLSRAVGRQREIAIRTAIGASRWRIIRQLLTESVALALAGGVVGTLLAYWSLHWVHVLGPASVPRINNIDIDTRALVFTALISVFAGVLFGLAPALRISHLDVYTTLKDASRGSGTSAVWGRGKNLRRLLVVSELALCVMLLIGAGLLVRSFRRLLNVSPGFNPRNVLTTELTMSGLRYNNPQAVLSTYKQLSQRLEQLPGATAAGAISSLPLSQMFAWGPITVEGRIPPPGENFINADIRIVNGHYFQAMQIPLLSGRDFSEADDLAHERVVIVDQYMAEQLWPGQDAVGKRIRNGGLDSKEPWIKVVGIVGRIKQYTLDSDSRIALYLPQGQYPTRAMNVVLRTSVDPATMSAAVAQEVHRIDPNLPLYNVLTMEQRVKESLARRRFSMLLLTLFACLALVLTAIGIYGVMAYLVSQGTREIGIRMALGATPGVILKHVVRQGMTMAFSGAVVGLIGAFLLSRLIRSLLFGVRAADPLTFAVISLLLMLVALAASYIPAQRAAQVEPVVSLRYE